MKTGRCIIVFVKLPEAGKVKTRLARDIGENEALDAYHATALDTVDALRGVDALVRIWHHPSASSEQVGEWLGAEWQYAPQCGRDLGERMHHAFLSAFSEGAGEAVLIGSDIPGMSRDVLEAALRALATHDAVIGPAADGGYYLIGFRKQGYAASVFSAMAWSTPAVFEETMRRIRDSRCSVYILETRDDLDTRDDLLQLAARSAAGKEAFGRRTASFLDRMRRTFTD